MSRFYITTAIDYVNSRPHLGTAYEKVTADVIARYRRLAGDDTRFLMGNDEHSQNVYRKARELGLDPLAYCDRMEGEFRAVWSRLDISFDDFVRTSEPRHRAGVTRMVERIGQAGDLYEGFYEGFYCVGCEAFKPEKDLVDGLCPVHQTRPDWIREKNHFFRLSRYRDRLLEHVTANPGFIEPEIRRNEILRLLESGLEDISISRAGQQWGIPLPGDPGSVVYVWFDALINYISAAGYGTDHQLFARWWPADLHVIGKDITRFHCVVWPAMLMSAALDLPRQVFGHGFISLKGQKMSKSLGTVLDPLDAAARFGPDPLRLFLVREIPYGQDGDFSWERFEERYNSDLANNLGNLVNRLAAMTAKYRGGRLSAVGASSGRLAGVADGALGLYRPSMERLALHEGAAAAFRLVDAANEYIAETEPWALARRPESQDRLTGVLQDVAEALRIAAVMLLPVMPRSAAEILRRVGETREVSELRFERDGRWQGARERMVGAADPLWPRIEAAATSTAPVKNIESEGNAPALPAASPEGSAPTLPPALEEKIMSNDVPEGTPPAASAEPAPVAPAVTPAGPGATEGATLPPAQVAAPSPEDARISIDEFMKVELRVARIVAAERVPKAQKLVKMLIDLGKEERTIVAGIAEAYQPDALVGKSIVVVANLKPARVRGIESNGMLLAASPDGGMPTIVTFEQAPPPGTRVR